VRDEKGFLDYPDNGLTTAPETLKDIYDNALILLYRLIFILYAEARKLIGKYGRLANLLTARRFGVEFRISGTRRY
jgi:hypothetical protein